MSLETTTFSPRQVGVGDVEARRHCLVQLSEFGATIRHRLTAAGLTIGRAPPAEIVVSDTDVSRSHCRLFLSGHEVLLVDNGSTNGTFLDGERVEGTRVLPVGAVVRVGGRVFRHEVLSEAEVARAESLDRDLRAAVGYVRALLPPTSDQGPLLVDWHFEPSARLGGDAFGCERLEDGRVLVYLLDVSGHGAGSALHAVSVMHMLKRGTLGVDPGEPAAVLSALDRRFPMEDHAEMFFTIWYGVFDPETRLLRHAAAGHHAAVACPTVGAPRPVGTRNRMIGAVIGRPFQEDAIFMPPGATLYLFSDGVFEIDTVKGRGSFADFAALLPSGPVTGVPAAVHGAVRASLLQGGFEDDFSLLGVTFA